MNNPLVSICCITYNHEKFIGDALEGFLEQKVNFDYEIIIADDGSTDQTPFIVENYIKDERNQEKIKFYHHLENIGMMANFIFALQHCNGKYIALCEGDDYWIDPYKLQKQVEFLEKNQNYNLCFHKVRYVDSDGKDTDFLDYNQNTEETTDFDYLCNGNYINTCSVVFRNNNNLLSEFTKFKDSIIGDWVLFLLVVNKQGLIKMLPERMACYRIHASGIWSFKKKGLNDLIKYATLKRELYHYFGKTPTLRRTLVIGYIRVSYLAYHEKNILLWLSYKFKAIFLFKNKIKNYREFIKDFVLFEIFH